MVQNRYYSLLSLHVFLKFVPHIAAGTRNEQQQKTPRAHQQTCLLKPCAHGKLNVKHHRTTMKSETPVTSREGSCSGEKVEKEHLTDVSKRHSHHQPPHDSKQRNYLVEPVRVCRLAFVAAAARCCSHRDNENPHPPNEARAIGREECRAISAQLAGRVVRTCWSSCIFWPPRGWGFGMSEYPTCSKQSN